MIKTRWNQKPLDAITQKKIDAYLLAAGEAGQNAFAFSSPIITGALKNSMSYFVDNGTNSGGKNKVTRPSRKNTVRIGSSIIYAASVEKRGKSAGWMSRAWDFLLINKTFEKLARLMNI